MSRTASEIWLAGGSDEAYWEAWWTEAYGHGPHPGGWDECMCCPLPDDEDENPDD
ncbi:hypothetical protein [Glycomyces buryatensis]|uniref:hypothetical protein n=1 Tax=Glycomyces buryatensis TaxID=2570927 RepID=UPI001456293D|nr:hypothetical protein [Glycomyces buryatensis]